MNRFFVIIFSLAFAVAAVAQQSLGFGGESHAQVGVYIKDLKTGAVVADINGQRVVTPASVTKALTSATALSILGPEFRFSTNVMAAGSIDRDGTLNGDLVIVASGDPTLESSQFKDNRGFCDSVAVALTRLGVKKISGTLRVRSNMPGEGPIPQWEVEDLGYGYGAGIFGLNWRDNVFELNVSTGATKPSVPDITVHKERTTDGGTDVIRGIYSHDVYVTGPSVGKKDFTVGTTMPDPAAAMLVELRTRLQAAGIACGTKSRGAGSEETLVYVHQSPRCVDILRSLMVRSDNMMAEGMLRAIAPGKSRKACLESEKSLWADRGLGVRFLSLFDGSGLTRATRMSPAFISSMLEYMASGDMAADYVSLFPLAGKEGTVKSFFKDTRLEGRLALKSGSMNGVQAYAGYLLGDDRKPTHTVVFIINGFYCSRADLRTAIVKFALSKFE